MKMHTIAPEQDHVFPGKETEEIILNTLLLTLQRFSHASEYLKWLEEAVFSAISDNGQPETELSVAHVLHILESVHRRCQLVKELRHNMLRQITQIRAGYAPQRPDRLFLDDLFVMAHLAHKRSN